MIVVCELHVASMARKNNVYRQRGHWPALLTAAAWLLPSAHAQVSTPARQGLQEVVVSVRDLNRSVSTLRAVTGGAVRHRGTVDAGRAYSYCRAGVD